MFAESWVDSTASKNDKRICGNIHACKDALSEWVTALSPSTMKPKLYRSLFLILRMGGGKGSLILNLGVMARKAKKMLILIASLNAIKWDLKKRLDHANIVSMVYKKGAHERSDLFMFPPTVLMLTAETALDMLRSCSDKMQRLIDANLIFHVVIDEVDSFVLDQVREINLYYFYLFYLAVYITIVRREILIDLQVKLS